MEYLETKGVPVIGYGTEELPAFYTRRSGFRVDYQLDTPKELAEAFAAQRGSGLHTGMLVANPIPEEYSMDGEAINGAINEAIKEAAEKEFMAKKRRRFCWQK